MIEPAEHTDEFFLLWQFILEKRASGTDWESIADLLSWPVKKLRAWRRENNFDNDGDEPMPSDNVVVEVMDALLLMGYKYKDIAAHLGISVDQLFRWRNRTGYQHPRLPLDSNDLDNVVRSLTAANRDRGEVMLMACINDMGYRTTELCLRESLHRVDPDGGILIVLV